MTRSYDPKPGSIPYRVIAHLETLQRGAEVSSAQLAQISGADPNSFTAIMGAARAGGAIFARQKGGFYHDGRFADLAAVVDHYDRALNLNLDKQAKADLVEYLKSL